MGFVRPSACTVVSTPAIALDGTSLIARRQPASRPLAASTPLSMSTASAPLDSCSRRRSRRIVDEVVDGEDRRRPRAANAERLALPERRAGGVDDARRVEHVADREPVVQRAGEAERDDAPVGHAVHRANADTRRDEPDPLRDPLLRRRRAGEGQPVSVHAMLRTVSFRLFDDSNAADGSNPEWMPQCSQRGSLPGPYASHSMPSSSAS